MSSNSQTTAQLKSGFHELIKQYYVYDGLGRLAYLYEATVATGDGEPCLLTNYSYDGTTTRIQKIKEENSTWDSSWD